MIGRLLLVVAVAILGRTAFGNEGGGWVTRPRPAKDYSTGTKLEEAVGRKYDPEYFDLKALRRKLGKNFDPAVMSIRTPSDLALNPNGTVSFPFKRNKKGRLVPVGNIPKSIRKLHYGSLGMPDGTKLRTRLSAKLRRKLAQFLWAYTACPVYHKWRDLGSRFWPRWLNEGHCHTQRSCSIPPGMTCTPSQFQYKVLLRWYCKDWDKAKECGWIQVRHPVVTACACDCNGAHKREGDDDDDDDGQD